jgi:hypothetical protein
MLGNLGAFLKKRIHFYLFIVLLIPLLWLQFTLPSPSTHNLDHLQSVFSNRQSEAETFANSVKSEWLKDDLRNSTNFVLPRIKVFSFTFTGGTA